MQVRVMMLRVMQVRVMMLLDGMMGGVVAPSLSERVLVFTPMQLVALLGSSVHTRSLVLKLFFQDDSAQMLTQQELSQQLLAFGSSHAPSVCVLLANLLMQTALHYYRRQRWLFRERARVDPGVCVCVCVFVCI
jgi:hypothetical protein